MSEIISTKAQMIQSESKKLKRGLTVLPLFGLIYFTVCGGSFGSEPLVGLTGPGMALILLIATPLLFSIPNMFMVREMGSMMPVEGGYYHWVKKAFGPLAGFLTGWMNLVVSWLDVSIYPVLALYYMSFFFPVLSDGIMNGETVVLTGDTLSWIIGLVMIWLIVLLQIRGARLTGLTTNWIGLLMLTPLLIMSIIGFINIARNGVTETLPLLPEGQTLFGAFSVGLFIAMWNFMGWELPSSAGDEIVNPKRTYPLAMALTLVAAIATYAIPMVAGLYGGAGDQGKYNLWIAEPSSEDGIIGDMPESITEEKLAEWGVDPAATYGWEYTDIANQIGITFTGEENGFVTFLVGIVSISAFLSMVGLFIGNSLGASRVPFALAQDGMMPGWMVKVHPKYGTPWVAILISGILFSIFTLQTFQALVVMDVFLNCMALVLQFLAMWKMRFSHPDVPRQKVPGGWVGLILVTLAPFLIILLAIVSNVNEAGWDSVLKALGAIAVGVLLYLPLRKFVKPGIPDIDPFHPAETQPETA